MRAGQYIPEQTFESVSVSSDGQIAYAAGDEVYVDGEQVTSRDADYTFAYWLEDRNAILGLADENNTYRYEFVEIDPDKGREHIVLPNDEGHLRMRPVRHPTEPNIVGFVSPEGQGVTVHEVDLDTGAVEEIVVADRPILHFDYSPDGESIVFQTGAMSETALHIASRSGDGYETVRDTPGAEDFLHYPASEFSMRSYWEEDGILFGSNADDTADIGLLQPDGEVTWLVRSDRDKIPVGWSPDGRAAYTAVHPGTTTLKIVDGDTETVVSEGGTVDYAHWTANGLAYIYRDYDTPAAIVVNGEPEYSENAPVSGLVEPTTVSYTSTDDTTIHGLLYEPEGKPDKAIVYAHGGPVLRTHRKYEFRKQFLANEGIAVLSIDFRGSGGYGRAFRTATDGDVGGPDVDDVVHGADFLREREYDAVGVAGHSYGGFLALMSVIKTDAFDFGISYAGPTDWEGVLEAAFDSDWVIRKLDGTPEENPEMYRGRSPIAHVTDVSVPLLFLHGEDDMNVPKPMVDEFTEELDRLGKPYEYATYDSEGHEFNKRSSKVDSARQMAQFVSEYS